MALDGGVPTVTDYNDWQGKRVLLRVDFNVTLSDDGTVLDDFRIRKSRPTIDYLRERGARVILVSHMKHNKELISLENVSRFFNEEVPHTFVTDVFASDGQDVLENMNNGDVVLLENIRLHEGETENDETFAQKLSSLADMYVNDAFAVSHREHASIVGVPQHIPGYLGLLMVDEIENLAHAFHPEHPFVFVLGGVKFGTKLGLIEKFLDRADTVFVGGALANDVFKAQGYDIGASLVSDGAIDIKHLVENESLHIPHDVVVETSDGTRVAKRIDDVQSEERIFDIGPESMDTLAKHIEEASFVLWNGPMGNYEAGYTDATFACARMISKSKAESVIGGGDTLAATRELDLTNTFSFVSTGGGAMLTYLAHETLVGIEALRKK